MRVLHLLNELQFSGAERMLVSAQDTWTRHGIETFVVATGAEVGPYAPTLHQANIETYHMPYRRSPTYLWRMSQLFREFDVVHIHAERGSFWLGLAALLVGKRRILRTVHASFPFNGMLRRRRQLQRRLLQMLGVIFVVPSPSVAKNERDRFGLTTITISNWVDPTLAVPTPDEVAEAKARFDVQDTGAVIITVIGNCSPVKNHAGLISGLAMIADLTDWQFWHVGREDSEHSDVQLAHELGIGQRCRFFGTREDVSDVLKATDIFAMVSLREGLGMAAVEALAMGRRCLFTEVDGLRDLAGLGDITWSNVTATALAANLRKMLAGELRDDQPHLPQTVLRRFGREGIERMAALYRGDTAVHAHQ
jgi:glycosyltransferase involved in cell wall biosynthesis